MLFTMKTKLLAQKAKISHSHLSNIANHNRVPSYRVAAVLAKLTGTGALLWFTGTKAQIKKAIRGA